MDVDKKILRERAVREGKLLPLEAFEAVWQEPAHSLPFFKFRNDNQEQFDTSFYILMEYINHEYEQHSSILDSLFRRGRSEEQLPEPRTAKP